MRILITGAAGKIGTQLVEELSSGHQLVLVDRAPVPGRRSVVADLGRDFPLPRWFARFTHAGPRWAKAFDGVDVVLHLAADPRPTASWDSVLRNNIRATSRVLEAAAAAAVPRVVFASSFHVVLGLDTGLLEGRIGSPDGAGNRQAGSGKIGSSAPPTPLSAYGLSKAWGELCGRMFVDQGRLRSFVAVRIGTYLPAGPRGELRPCWVGSSDLRSLLRRCVEAEIEGHHVVYAVSAQPEAPFDLAHTTELLAWSPEQRP